MRFVRTICGPFAAVSTTLFAMFGATAFAAENRLVPQQHCDAGATEDARQQFPDVLDPKLRGVGLADLDHPEAQMVDGFLRLKGVLKVNEVLNTAAVEIHADHVVADVIARAARFDDTDTRREKNGRVGILRVRVPVSAEACDVGEPEVLWERSLTDLDLRYRVSISECAALLEDATLGFRRVFPLGCGGIDNGVRYPGILSSMTPTTDDGLLEKDYAWRELGSPWYFRKKPYLPISLGRTFTRKDGTTWKSYTESMIAFHIWQDKGFERGFFSHGCMRMRTADLAELAGYVFGARAPIPVKVKLDPLGDARHPYPMDTVKYWQLKNFGTAEKPRTRMKYMLHEMELGTTPLPDLSKLVPMTFDSKPILPDSQVSAP